jgi:hypothetical protein
LLTICDLDDKSTTKMADTLQKAVELRSLPILKALLKTGDAQSSERGSDEDHNNEEVHYHKHWIQPSMVKTAITLGGK